MSKVVGGDARAARRANLNAGFDEAGDRMISGPLSENHGPRQVAETQQARGARLLAHELRRSNSARIA